MAAPLLFRALPLFRRRLVQHNVHLRTLCAAAVVTESTGSDGDKSPSLSQIFSSKPVKDLTHYPICDLYFQTWKSEYNKAEILEDIEPIIRLTKEILHSNRYMDGERLTPDDEKVVVDKLLAYHPRSEEKIGCGVDSIMVDRHPQFKKSRCLFVVRTDGGWIDFSYQKCLGAYIQDKYPSRA